MLANVLSKRLPLWKEGDIDLLVREAAGGKVNQSNLPKPASKSSFDTVAEWFNGLMLIGKVNQALRILSKGVLPMNADENLKVIHQKHPARWGKVRWSSSWIWINWWKSNTKNRKDIRDADDWKRILTSASFGNTSDNLCNAIASMARKLCLVVNCQTQQNRISKSHVQGHFNKYYHFWK